LIIFSPEAVEATARNGYGKTLAGMSSLPDFVTHQVENQSPRRENVNVFASDPALREAVEREGAAAATEWLSARGADIGSAEMIALADAANRTPPVLKLYDERGFRRDQVEFHPAYHELMAFLKRHGASAGPWAIRARARRCAVPRST
jgi:putative acyl-CoA dehydrogenase